MKSSSPSKRVINKGIFLIFIDCIVIIMVMLVFNAFGSMQNTFSDAATQLHVLPQELLLFLLIIVISPAIHNIHYNVRTIAKALTALTMESPHYVASSEKHIYSIFANLGNVAMLNAVLVLIIPFIPEDTIIGPVGLAIIVVSAIIIIYLAWDT